MDRVCARALTVCSLFAIGFGILVMSFLANLARNALKTALEQHYGAKPQWDVYLDIVVLLSLAIFYELIGTAVVSWCCRRKVGDNAPVEVDKRD